MYMNATPISVHFERGNVSIDVRCDAAMYAEVFTTGEIALIVTALDELCNKLGVIAK